MLTTLLSTSLSGLDATLVHVEVDVTAGMPAFSVVGLPDTIIEESRERVRAAVRNSDFTFPSARITVNLAPALIRKRGAFDLPIALGIVGNKTVFRADICAKSLFVGELALDGRVRHTEGILSTILFARESGYEYVFLPEENLEEARIIP